jgi:DNA-binding GntR family transcriptional regulator
MDTLAPARESLHERLVAGLRDLVIEGELPAGARVPERVLCERFGVSRTPLREALKVLASEGLVELLPNRGARIARLTEKDVEDMFQVMAALESLSGALACQRITEGELAEIRALHYQMLAHYMRRQLPEYFRFNQAIHEAILDAARNPALKATYRTLAGRIRRARYLANMSDERWAEAVAEHEAILAALIARDAPRLSQLLATHLENKSEVVRAALSAGTSPALAPAGIGLTITMREP